MGFLAFGWSLKASSKRLIRFLIHGFYYKDDIFQSAYPLENDYFFKETKLISYPIDNSPFCSHSDDFKLFHPHKYSHSIITTNRLPNIQPNFQLTTNKALSFLNSATFKMVIDLFYSIFLVGLTFLAFYLIIKIKMRQNIQRRQLSLSYTYSNVESIPSRDEETDSLNIA